MVCAISQNCENAQICRNLGRGTAINPCNLRTVRSIVEKKMTLEAKGQQSSEPSQLTNLGPAHPAKKPCGRMSLRGASRKLSQITTKMTLSLNLQTQNPMILNLLFSSSVLSNLHPPCRRNVQDGVQPTTPR